MRKWPMFRRQAVRLFGDLIRSEELKMMNVWIIIYNDNG
jgi:hypothetical protein